MRGNWAALAAGFIRKLAPVSLAVVCFTYGCAFAAGIEIDQSPYKSGLERYFELKQNEAYQQIEGHFIEAPLDYSHPENGTFDLFYRVSSNFDSKKPTVLFFVGGPGIPTFDITFEKALPGFNFIYFDQRGSGFSHFRTFGELQNPMNFSSELIARDAELIRQTVGVESVSIWGHSYGTVPATIYASTYSTHVTAVVLEGVVFDGNFDLWTSDYRLKLIQSYFDQLPIELKNQIEVVSNSGRVRKDWFSQVARATMYSRNFRLSMNAVLINLFYGNQSPYNQINSMYSTDVLSKDSDKLGAYTYHQISCQEFNIGDERVALGAEIKNGRLIPYPTQGYRANCLSIPGMNSRMSGTYSALNYPIEKPVTYIEGTTDGATAPTGAMRHFKNAAKGRAQLLYVLESGHTSAIDCLQDSVTQPARALTCDNSAAVAEAVKLGFQGNNIPSELLKKMSTGNRWMKASKLRSKIPTK